MMSLFDKIVIVLIPLILKRVAIFVYMDHIDGAYGLWFSISARRIVKRVELNGERKIGFNWNQNINITTQHYNS